MNKFVILCLLTVLPFVTTEAFAQQQVNVSSATPCFLNYTTQGIEMWQNCGFDTDYMNAVVLPFEWVTGGLFSMIVVIILIGITWVKYRSPLYPLAIGVIMMPTSFYLFPDVFVSFAFLLAAVTIGAVVWAIFIQKTRG